jgi:hypothetical protein
MPHTQSRYQQDLGFTDGRVRASVGDIIFTGATLAITRVAAGQWGVVLGTPAAQANTFAINVTQALIRRLGFGEDLQEQFGGAGIPGSAQPQFYRPDVIGAMSAAQQLQPRTALKVKGFKLLSFDVIYSLGVAAATTHTCRVDQSVFSNNVAIATTAVLASGANGLAVATQANPYVTNVPLAAGQQIYRTLADTDLWIEDVITGAATTTVTFWGFDLIMEFNYN